MAGVGYVVGNVKRHPYSGWAHYFAPKTCRNKKWMIFVCELVMAASSAVACQRKLAAY